VLVGDDVATPKTEPRLGQINLLGGDSPRRAPATLAAPASGDKLFPERTTRRDATLTDFRYYHVVCLQCFDAVGWAAGRASGL